MSGTSLDGIDAILVDFSRHPHIIETHSAELPDALREEIHALNSLQPNELGRSLVLGKQLAHLFGKAAKQLLDKTGIPPKAVTAIGSHGQTLRHAPDGPHGFSLQVGDPSTIAELTGITVVADFRNRDIAAGGQGAPLVPAFHQAVFSHIGINRAIINIGGMANASVFRGHDIVHGFDTGPGNVLMNHWTQQHTGNSYDANGEWARSGQVNRQLLDRLLQDPYFRQAPPKSTGREHFDMHWLESFHPQTLAPADVQATLLELTARSIVDALPNDMDEMFICGGGARNLYLMERLASLSGITVASTDVLGIAPEWVEAAAFAWLARQCINHACGNLPEATGAEGARILGGIYPGHPQHKTQTALRTTDKAKTSAD